MADRIGDILVRIGAMTQEQVADVLQRQQEGDNRLFGEIAIEVGYINEELIAEYLALKADE